MTGDHFEGSGTNELDGLLLDAKLSIPKPRPAVVSRASIISSCRASARRVVDVTAPAGYGKSTLLAQWADTEDRRVAWVSLDRLDDDPMVLLSTLASAYARVSPDDRCSVREVAPRVPQWVAIIRPAFEGWTVVSALP